MALSFVEYSPVRVQDTLDVYAPYLGNPVERDMVSRAVMKLGEVLGRVGWTVEENIHATASNTWPYGFPYWTDPDQPYIVFGNVVKIQGVTIHLVTPYQLLHDPPLYPGVVVRLAGNTSAETGDIVAQAITDYTALDAWLDYTGEYPVMQYRAKVGGPGQNNIGIDGNGAWCDYGISKGGGSTFTSQAAHGVSAVSLSAIEDSSSHLVFVPALHGTALDPYSLAWKRSYTLVANPYGFRLFLKDHATDITWYGDGHQYNSFFWIEAPFIEVPLRSAITYCAFALTGRAVDRDAMSWQGWDTVTIAINGQVRHAFAGIDGGMALPLTRVPADECAGQVLTSGGHSLMRRARLALPRDLSVEDSATGIVGVPWDAFTASAWHDWNTFLNLDGHRWVRLVAGGKGTNGASPGSLFIAID